MSKGKDSVEEIKIDLTGLDDYGTKASEIALAAVQKTTDVHKLLSYAQIAFKSVLEAADIMLDVADEDTSEHRMLTRLRASLNLYSGTGLVAIKKLHEQIHE